MKTLQTYLYFLFFAIVFVANITNIFAHSNEDVNNMMKYFPIGIPDGGICNEDSNCKSNICIDRLKVCGEKNVLINGLCYEDRQCICYEENVLRCKHNTSCIDNQCSDYIPNDVDFEFYLGVLIGLIMLLCIVAIFKFGKID